MPVDVADLNSLDELADCGLSELQAGPDNISGLCTEIEDISGTEVVDEPMIFPCVMVDGVSTAAEVRMLQQLSANAEEGVAVPLYVSLDKTQVHIGNFPLVLDCLLLLKFLGGYAITLYNGDGLPIRLNLDDPVQLTKFIRL